jgi:hypothetical protein
MRRNSYHRWDTGAVSQRMIAATHHADLASFECGFASLKHQRNFAFSNY